MIAAFCFNTDENSIKDHCMCSWGAVIIDDWINVQISDPDARRNLLERASNILNRSIYFGNPIPVVTEVNVWIGFGAIILPGVTIGRGAVIGCKAVIKENVPPYAVMVGDPAKK